MRVLRRVVRSSFASGVSQSSPGGGCHCPFPQALVRRRNYRHTFGLQGATRGGYGWYEAKNVRSEEDETGRSSSAHIWTNGGSSWLVPVTIIAQAMISQPEDKAGPMSTVRRKAKRRSFSTSSVPSVSQGSVQVGCHFFRQARIQTL